MSGAHSLLSPEESAVLGAIRQRGSLQTRIKEFGDHDQEFLCQESSVAEPLRLSDDDVLNCLHTLEGRGLAVCRMSIHLWSATEYICEWTTGGSGDSDADVETTGP
jgi:hypothetical protein